MQKFLIVGLGNKGAEYEYTRHNIGFLIVDRLASLLNTKFSSSNFGLVAETSYKGRKLFILKPDTYVNLSGKAVKFWKKKENIPLENIMVALDDLSLAFGSIRIKSKGNHAGHNGLKNIDLELATDQYARLRFGIGNEFEKGNQIDYVLGRWTEEEAIKMSERIEVCSQAILTYVFSGINTAMNNFNNK